MPDPRRITIRRRTLVWVVAVLLIVGCGGGSDSGGGGSGGSDRSSGSAGDARYIDPFRNGGGCLSAREVQQKIGPHRLAGSESGRKKKATAAVRDAPAKPTSLPAGGEALWVPAAGGQSRPIISGSLRGGRRVARSTWHWTRPEGVRDAPGGFVRSTVLASPPRSKLSPPSQSLSRSTRPRRWGTSSRSRSGLLKLSFMSAAGRRRRPQLLVTWFDRSAFVLGPVTCLTVTGNRATIGFENQGTFSEIDKGGFLLVEDNGTPGAGRDNLTAQLVSDPPSTCRPTTSSTPPSSPSPRANLPSTMPPPRPPPRTSPRTTAGRPTASSRTRAIPSASWRRRGSTRRPRIPVERASAGLDSRPRRV